MKDDKVSDDIGEKLVNFVKYSLKGMSKNFINLSKIKLDQVNEELKKQLIEHKIQERPFIYEFYHQFRKYWSLEAMKKVFGTLAYIQFQVNEKYQNISNLDPLPDFLINEANISASMPSFKYSKISGSIPLLCRY